MAQQLFTDVDSTSFVLQFLVLYVFVFVLTHVFVILSFLSLQWLSCISQSCIIAWQSIPSDAKTHRRYLLGGCRVDGWFDFLCISGPPDRKISDFWMTFLSLKGKKWQDYCQPCYLWASWIYKTMSLFQIVNIFLCMSDLDHKSWCQVAIRASWGSSEWNMINRQIIEGIK